MTEQASPMERAFDNLDTSLASTAVIRNELIATLHTAVSEFKFSIKDSSAEDRESFMAVINSLDGLLKGKEKSALDNVKVQLMQKGESNSQEIAKSVTQLLHMISLNGGGKPVEILTHLEPPSTVD